MSREQIVLTCAWDGSNAHIARELGTSRETVRKWRARFAKNRLERLTDASRPGAPRTITDAQIEALLMQEAWHQHPSGVRDQW